VERKKVAKIQARIGARDELVESGTEGKEQSIDRGQVKFADLKFPIPNSRVLPTIADFHRCVCLYAIFDYFYVGVSS